MGKEKLREYICPKCNTYMENDDFYYDEERKDYIDIWICPNCGYREDIPE